MGAWILFLLSAWGVPASQPAVAVAPPAITAARSELDRAAARAVRIHEAFAAGVVSRTEVESADRAVDEARERYERLAAGPQPLTPQAATEERRRAEERLAALRRKKEQWDGLWKEGLVSRREVEELAASAREAEEFLDLARWREQEMDHERELARRVEEWQARGGRFDPRVFTSLETAYQRRFGNPLPISAMGMTGTHAAMNFNHAGRVDVALHPDSPEGRWLIAELQLHDIPYVAFRSAVRGKATGAHIHLGFPSPPLHPSGR